MLFFQVLQSTFTVAFVHSRTNTLEPGEVSLHILSTGSPVATAITQRPAQSQMQLSTRLRDIIIAGPTAYHNPRRVRLDARRLSSNHSIHGQAKRALAQREDQDHSRQLRKAGGRERTTPGSQESCNIRVRISDI